MPGCTKFRPGPGTAQTYVSELAFFDTAVLLDLFDKRDPVKRRKAAETFRSSLSQSLLNPFLI